MSEEKKIELPKIITELIPGKQEQVKTPENFENFEPKTEEGFLEVEKTTGEQIGEGIGVQSKQTDLDIRELKEKEKEIEKILELGLRDLYLDMPEEARMTFKQKGEETTRKIVVLITNGKATLKKIVDLIRSWLIIIPGINKFFLEQEAKIKADEILDFTRKDR